MPNNNYSRRKFLEKTMGAGLALSGAGLYPSLPAFGSAIAASTYDPKGLPTRMLGKTGMMIPRIAMGLGSRFCTIRDAQESYNLLTYALDHGLYYWDTAWFYENQELHVISEERIGQVLKVRRNEVFLSTKVTSRDPGEAMRQIETSLKRLQTDHLDMLKIHDVQTMQDVARLSEKGNLIDILHRMKDQGVTRFIGFSGHTEAAAMKAMADRGDFDSMLIAMNHWNEAANPQSRQESAVPAARAKGMGVMLMKVVRPKETIPGIVPADLVRYALSLKDPDGIVLGMESLEVVKSNLEILRHFQPLDETGMQKITLHLAPYFSHQNLPWMKPGYCDGQWT